MIQKFQVFGSVAAGAALLFSVAQAQSNSLMKPQPAKTLIESTDVAGVLKMVATREVNGESVEINGQLFAKIPLDDNGAALFLFPRDCMGATPNTQCQTVEAFAIVGRGLSPDQLNRYHIDQSRAATVLLLDDGYVSVSRKIFFFGGATQENFFGTVAGLLQDIERVANLPRGVIADADDDVSSVRASFPSLVASATHMNALVKVYPDTVIDESATPNLVSDVLKHLQK